MTTPDLDELEALAAKATPGAWVVDGGSARDSAWEDVIFDIAWLLTFCLAVTVAG